MKISIGVILFFLFIGILALVGVKFMELHFSPDGEVFEPKWDVDLEPADCEGSDDKDTCYTYIAAKYKDDTWCERVSAEKLSSHANLLDASKTREVSQKDVCYVLVAVTTEDVNLCEKLRSEKLKENVCYSSIAISTKNVGLCNQISDKDLRVKCKKKVKGIFAFLY